MCVLYEHVYGDKLCKQNIFVLCEHVYENKLREQKLSADKDTETFRGSEIERRTENDQMGSTREIERETQTTRDR